MARDHVLVLPGGGYITHTEHEAEPVAEWLRGLGVEASVYRHPLGTVHPAPLDAVRSEIARMRRAGAARVGVLGFSAGGHAAGLAALAPGAGAADLAVLCYPVVSMVLPGHDGSRVALLGESATDQEREAVSLERLVTPRTPPMFLWHTADDATVPVAPVYRLAEALSAAAVTHSVHVYPSGIHGLGLAQGSGLPESWTTECAAWLRSLGWGTTF
ncbi:prolyl oligopeptidase family serine peptidase [Rathayibacter sp. VKM Ac-2835]|uniref:alpha/beta hydrolase n=1 Tax=Rathayibacter sp. VKM Ac-2835 TaxID=2739043 RepID=UPI00156304F9|nr:prolyl oligopeptidase family serine peptidase [Rathayibacter sp. VKM Ac-2835]NRG43023.1 prolyl oligopeptidase family serine peptidase [Rathayibacter sp. VKM Ac-2835]